MNKNLPVEYTQTQPGRWRDSSPDWSSYKGEQIVKERLLEACPEAKALSIRVSITRRWSSKTREHSYFTRVSQTWYDWTRRRGAAQRSLVCSKANVSVDLDRLVEEARVAVKNQESKNEIDARRRTAENASSKLAESLNKELGLSFGASVLMSGATGSTNAENVVVKFETTVSPEKAREIAKVLQSLV